MPHILNPTTLNPTPKTPKLKPETRNPKKVLHAGYLRVLNAAGETATIAEVFACPV